MARWDQYSRDETEIGAFGDTHLSESERAEFAEFGGFFNSLTKKLGLNKGLEKDIKAKTGSTVTVNVKNPTAAQIATGMGKSALMLAPIVASAGGAALVAPALLAAAPVAKSVVSVGKTVAPTVKAADKLISDAQRGVKSAVTTINNTRIAAAAGLPGAAAGNALLLAIDAARRAAGVQPGRPQPAVPMVAKPPAVDPFLADALASIRTAAEADNVWALYKRGRPASTRIVTVVRAEAAKGNAQAKAGLAALTAAEKRSVASSSLTAKLAAAAPAPGQPAPVALALARPTSIAAAAASDPAALLKAKLVASSSPLAVPKYLVLDSGQVLEGLSALAGRLEKQTGWLVARDGKVTRA